MIVLDLDRLSLLEQAEAYEREADYLASTIRMFGQAGRGDPGDLRHYAACIRAELAALEPKL